MVRTHPDPPIREFTSAQKKGMNKSKIVKTPKAVSDLLKLKPKNLLLLGEQLREEDRHDEAVCHLTLALAKFQKEKSYAGIIDSLKGRVLTWKHYFLLTNDYSYAILAKKDSEAMLAIAQEKKLKDKLSTSYFRLGEIDMLYEDYASAINNYQNALKHFSGIQAEKGDFRYHLGEAVYKNGDKDNGHKIMLQGLQEIQKNTQGVDPFLIHVWESGCYMRLAYLLRTDKPELASDYLVKAGEIVNSDPKLVIRRRQFNDLSKMIKKVKAR